MKNRVFALISALLISASLYAQEVNVNTGWHLVGATQDVDVSAFNNSGCTDYIWQYDSVTAGWKLHIANNMDYGYTGATISAINAGEGFWLKAGSPCYIANISNDGSTAATGGYTIDMILGQTFYSATTPSLNTTFTPYTSVVTFNTDGTRSYSKDGVVQADANYTIENGDLHIVNTIDPIDSTIKIVPNVTSDGQLRTLEIYNNLSGTPVHVANRLVFTTQADLDAYLGITSAPDLNITTVAASTLTFLNFTEAITFEEGDNEWYDVLTIDQQATPMAFSIDEYEYDGLAWGAIDTFGGTVTPNPDGTVSMSETNGFGADLNITHTEQITSVNGTPFNDLFMSDVEYTVTSLGAPWTDNWGWGPTYFDGTVDQAVVTNLELKEMFILGNSWTGGTTAYAMLDGTTGDISGNMVKGVQDGYWTGCTPTTDNDCIKIVRTTEVIGSWTFDASTGISIDLPNETETLSMIVDNTTATGYSVQSIGQDKVGAIFSEKMLTGSDAAGVIQSLLQPAP